MSFGYSVLGFGGHANRSSSPFAVSISSQDNLVILGEPPRRVLLLSASGGSGSYTYAWVLSEERDATSELDINTQGTANAAQYNDARVNWTMAAGPPFAHGFYRVTCTVNDGIAAAIVVQEDFEIILG